MDLKVYKKENVLQPNGISEDVYVPDTIDIYPVLLSEESGKEILKNAEILDDTDNFEELIEQAVALSTIWQRGLDPLELNDGNRWSELYLGEINVVQIMEDLTNSVESVSPSVSIDFDTISDSEGNSYFSYKIKVVS